LAHYLYWLTYFKRNGLKFWMIFLEKFGTPTVTAKANRQVIEDPVERGKLLDALQAIQVDGAVIIPEGVEIELLEAVRGGASDYDTLQERMNLAISKIVLSQTMTTDNGSSRSQSEVHKLVRDEVVESDAWLVDDSFNKTAVKWLTEWNFGEGVRPPIVSHARKEEEDLTQKAEIDTKIYSLGFEPTEDYIKQTYGEGWVKRVAPPMPQFAEFADAGLVGVKDALHRSDMDVLVKNAKALAQNYDEAIGDRVRQLMALLEDTKDYATFEKHLVELMETAPPEKSVTAVEKANFVARLLGALRGQR
jgi:phage gp29-like protein